MKKKYQHIVGEKIRKERLKYGLSLSDMSSKIGISPSFLSLLENGKAVPSLKVLDKISSFFSISLVELLAEEEEQEVFYFPKGRQIEVSRDSGITSRFLLPKDRLFFIEPCLLSLDPGSRDREFYEGKGLEFAYVLKGRVEFQFVGQKPITCDESDSILYRSSLLHRLANPSDLPALVFLVNVPSA